MNDRKRYAYDRNRVISNGDSGFMANGGGSGSIVADGYLKMGETEE